MNRTTMHCHLSTLETNTIIHNTCVRVFQHVNVSIHIIHYADSLS